MSVPERSPRILVVDDDEKIRRALRSILSSRKYDVAIAEDGEKAIDAAIDHTPDLIILDLSLPGLSGIEVCKELRNWYTGPILVLSVLGSENDKVMALDSGADDYLTKPFSAAEILARIRALLRRTSKNILPAATISLKDMEIDIGRRTVSRDGKEISLTRTEFDILAFLSQNPDLVLTYKMIMEKVWGPDYIEDTRTLRVHVSNLRRKIEPNPNVPRYIITEPGVGFRFNAV
ncbi:MAG: response regulator transcription factor [Candidatus Margulisiibacteriota bacterium]